MRVCPQCGFSPPKQNHKLSREAVLDIFNSGKPSRELATKYKITMWTVQKIKNGKLWSAITGKKFTPRRYRKK
jgi:DNA invertase Pin-like site-specific DNA recombinase